MALTFMMFQISRNLRCLGFSDLFGFRPAFRAPANFGNDLLRATASATRFRPEYLERRPLSGCSGDCPLKGRLPIDDPVKGVFKRRLQKAVKRGHKGSLKASRRPIKD